MPLTHERIDNDRGIVWSATGELIGDDMVATIREFWARAYPSSSVVYVFHDYGGVTDWRISARHIQENAEMRKAAYERKKTPRVIAAYAPSDVIFGSFRMWQTLAAEPLWETEVFRERHEAIAWLRWRVAERFGFQIGLK